MADPSSIEWRRHIIDCLNSTHYAAIATSGAEGPWVNPVYFAFDDSLTVYFISLPHSRHMQNIAAFNRVAIAVFNTQQRPGDDVTGVQMAGVAQRVQDSDLDTACAVYFGRDGATLGGYLSADPAAYTGDDPATWKFVRVDVDEFGYFNSELFGEERQDVPLHTLR